MPGRNSGLVVALAAATVIAGATTASAQMFGGGTWYGKVFGGATWPSGEDAKVKAGGQTIGEGDIDYDTGFTVGAALGYDYTPNFALELEYAYRKADVSSDDFGGNGVSNAFMLNALYKVDGMGANGAWRPYVGGGLGVANLDVKADDVGTFSNDADFAYQAIGGVAYDVSPAWTLTGELRWFGINSSGNLDGPGGLGLDTDFNSFDVLVGAAFNF